MGCFGVGYADAALFELPPYVPPSGRTFAHGRHKKAAPKDGFYMAPARRLELRTL
jgi:hypothetical protein